MIDVPHYTDVQIVVALYWTTMSMTKNDESVRSVSVNNTYMEEKMNKHNWTDDDDKKLKQAINDALPIFEHFKNQGETYSDRNAWDAVAGRLLPDICVTGAACRRRWERIREQDAWKTTTEQIERYERELAETTFDGVSEILGSMDAIFERIQKIESNVSKLCSIWLESE